MKYSQVVPKRLKIAWISKA